MAPVDIRRLYKRPAISDQQRRREKSLLRQAQNRQDAQNKARNVASAILSFELEPTTPEQDLSEIEHETQAINFDLLHASKLRGPEARRWFAKQLMLPEWMIDIPDNLISDWPKLKAHLFVNSIPFSSPSSATEGRHGVVVLIPSTYFFGLVMDLDLFDDTVEAPKNVRAGARFQPKSKLHPPKKPSVSSSRQVSTNEQSEVVNGSSEHRANSMVDSGPEKTEDLKASFERSTKENSDQPKRTPKKPSVSSSQQISTNEQSEVVNGSSENRVNSMVDSGPEKTEDLKASFERSTSENSDIMIELESLTDLSDSTGLPSEKPVSNVPDNPVIQSVVDDLSCFSHIPDISIAKDPLTENEFIVVEPVPNREDHTQTGPGKLASRRRAKSTKEDQASNVQEGTTNRLLRKRQNRENSFRLVDELEDDDDDAHASVGNDSEVQPNKSPAVKEKPSRKRKKDNKKTDETAKEPPKKKKFPHSTKRRKVDKSLLENPDDIDHRNVSLTNLIRLAEYKELAAKKIEGTTSSSSQPVPTPNQSTINNPLDNNGFHEYNEGVDIAFDEPGFFDGQPMMAEENSSFFNYHTFMNKTRRSKWTDQDTELFYEGVQQFGTDFTMIQQLFPERTRRQVKLKYKNEELKHPIRVREALMNPAKGHSHFDTVIERLKQIAAEEKKNDKNDDDDDYDSANVEDGDVDEHEPEPKNGEDESARIDHDQDVVDKEEEAAVEEHEDEENVAEQAYDSEDELFRWRQYKSDL